MQIFNSLSRKIERFAPMVEGKVGMYTCGPTVYSFASIGNWRTYVLGDLLVRIFTYLGYEVDYVMNITDVGHLTGDNLGDADTGEDRLEKAAKKEGKTAWDIAKFYTKDFYQGYEKLNLTKPRVWCKATDHIADQIEMVKRIMMAGFGYKIEDGIYFDTAAYELAGNTYGELSNLKEIKKGARIEPNVDKKNPRDFALWKFSPAVDSSQTQRQMEWDSPWGVGFPGWHIECSAMSQKYLGDQFDVHVGGEDLKSTHHPNEIAQAESATGKKPFVNYWVHSAFLLIDGGRMGKSMGNAFTIEDLEKKGFSAMDLRYFYLTGHYRKQLNFTWEALAGAKNSLNSLKDFMIKFKQDKSERTILSPEKMIKIDEFRERFKLAIENDLNMPEALAVMWETVKSSIPNQDKYDLILNFDNVLGLGMSQWHKESVVVPENVALLMKARELAREKGDYQTADELRSQISNLGFEVMDGAKELIINKKMVE